MRNNFPMFAEIPDMYKKDDVNYLVLDKDSKTGGFRLYHMNDMKDRTPLADDWFFEYEDVFISANQVFGVKKNDWKKMK